MKITKETIRRMLRTFLQVAVGILASNLALLPWTADSAELKAAVTGMLATAIAAGIAAIMNMERDGDRGGAGMTLDAFVKKYLGTAIDADGAAGAQCVDLIKLYLKDCFEITPFSFGGSARMLYENYSQMPERFCKAFVRIANTPELVPQRGDICVWGSGVGCGHGHVAIATGEGDTHRFISWDMNWYGIEMHRQDHNYAAFLGVLRPIGAQPVPGATYFKRYTGSSTSIVDALEAIGAQSSLSYWRKIAAVNGIEKYVGLPTQNRKMLAKLKAGTLIRP